ncbi:MAG: response regulator [Proteobacteria bacterium]|nr:response regulator [Burkholderiales bacterium]
MGAFYLLVSGLASEPIPLSLLCVSLLVAVVQLCFDWRAALLVLTAALVWIGSGGVTSATAVAAVAVSNIMLVLALEWRTRQAVLALAVSISERRTEREAMWVIDHRGRVVAANALAGKLGAQGSPISVPGSTAASLAYVDGEGAKISVSLGTPGSFRSIRLQGHNELGPFDVDAWPLRAFDLGGIVRLDDQGELQRSHAERAVLATQLADAHRQIELIAQERDGARDTRVKLERAMRGKDELLALVSHDLRSALNAMVGWLYLARSPRATGDAQQRALDGIESSVGTQRRRVEQLLDASRLLSGRVQLEVRDVDAGALFTRMESRFDARARARNVELKFERAYDRLSFLADPARVEESLATLIEHALAAAPDGARLRVQARPMEAAGGTPAENGVVLQVDTADTLVGELSDPALREPDERGAPDASGSRQRALSSLPLSIARLVTELQGGTLDLDPIAPATAGKRFKMRFPSSVDEATLATTRLRSDPAQPDTRGSEVGAAEAARDDPPVGDMLTGAFVLLVDDRDDMLEVTSTLLRGSGAHVTTARSGSEALALYPKWATGGGERLVVSDLSMPQLDGLALVERLRQLENEQGLPRVPAVAFSAHGELYSRRQVIDAGFDLFLAKPMPPQRLLDAISALLGR